MRASLLTVGDELLIGQVVDTNSAWIGQFLDERGVQLEYKQTVGDRLPAMLKALGQAAEHADIILITGGLGPTADDITLEALAAFLGREQVFQEEVFSRIEYIFTHVIKRPMTGSQRRQAMLPAGAEALKNERGTAPGVWIEAEGKIFVAMPGVPREMQYLMEAEVLPRLQSRFPVDTARRLTIVTAGHGETELEEAMRQELSQLPGHMGIAYLPNLGTVRLRLNASGPDASLLEADLEVWKTRLLRVLPAQSVIGFGEDTLVSVLSDRFVGLSLSLSTAESCTGGGIAEMITARPGASRFFMGSVVAYDNRIKEQVLGVDPAILEREGAVSEATVKAMALGVRKLMNTDASVATSGILGPGGGSEAKPVGTVWIAACLGEHLETRLLSLGKDRISNAQRTCNAALYLLWRLALKV